MLSFPWSHAQHSSPLKMAKALPLAQEKKLSSHGITGYKGNEANNTQIYVYKNGATQTARLIQDATASVAVFIELTSRAAKLHVLQITTHINIHRKKWRICDVERRSNKLRISIGSRVAFMLEFLQRDEQEPLLGPHYATIHLSCQ
jgi:hypothetical protein